MGVLLQCLCLTWMDDVSFRRTLVIAASIVVEPGIECIFVEQGMSVYFRCCRTGNECIFQVL